MINLMNFTSLSSDEIYALDKEAPSMYDSKYEPMAHPFITYPKLTTADADESLIKHIIGQSNLPIDAVLVDVEHECCYWAAKVALMMHMAVYVVKDNTVTTIANWTDFRKWWLKEKTEKL